MAAQHVSLHDALLNDFQFMAPLIAVWNIGLGSSPDICLPGLTLTVAVAKLVYVLRCNQKTATGAHAGYRCQSMPRNNFCLNLMDKMLTLY